jgi:two-component system, LuxR family, response regulator FixJ
MTTEAKQSLIYVVDDDASIRDALETLLSIEGYTVRSFGNGHGFVDAARTMTPAAVFLDVHMPGRSGLDILREMNANHYPAPIFIISGQGDIPMAVEAIKNGALDFIEKPFDPKKILERLREAIAAAQKAAHSPRPKVQSEFAGAEHLTPREAEVLHLIAEGASNKEAGRSLGISPRTIEVHRARIMEKLGAKNAADLVRIVLSRKE